MKTFKQLIKSLTDKKGSATTDDFVPDEEYMDIVRALKKYNPKFKLDSLGPNGSKINIGGETGVVGKRFNMVYNPKTKGIENG